MTTTFTALIDGVAKHFKASGTGSELDPFIPRHISESGIVADESNLVSAFLENATHGNDQCQDGSSTPIEYAYTAPAGKIFLCSRLMIYMEDSTNFTSESFGGLGVALTNGWGMALNGTAAFSVKTNWELAIHMFDITGNALFGKDNQTMIGRFSFNKFTGGSCGVTIRPGESISTILNDDLTNLDILSVMAQGILIDE
ncbi:hypothetical protein [Candidatus Venteria ishoeyi]|uniref:Uncharacterized protein n=1 Tax=Candidatus Venteria ishoeyi TaxID=1899563 RepID=A0A1H6F8Z3_9GAMM|nr:hypothetical protein [Candidatus Venteria ishoeyi]SEH05484.1 Uncharacterised protein [Candidatus Venteria ishoeyi]